MTHPVQPTFYCEDCGEEIFENVGQCWRCWDRRQSEDEEERERESKVDTYNAAKARKG